MKMHPCWGVSFDPLKTANYEYHPTPHPQDANEENHPLDFIKNLFLTPPPPIFKLPPKS